MTDIELLTQLRQLLSKRFSDGELRTLCFDLGVEYEDLPGAGKADKARELVDYMDRYERLPDLIRLGRQARPDVPWPDIGAQPVQPISHPALPDYKRKALETRLNDLTAEYEAASQQMSYTLSAADKLKLQRQLDSIAQEVEQVQRELGLSQTAAPSLPVQGAKAAPGSASQPDQL